MAWDDLPLVTSKAELVALAVALGAREIRGWSPGEEALVQGLPVLPEFVIAAAQHAVQQGKDPLGEAFCRLTTAEQRRPMGATYTPHAIIQAMLAWAGIQLRPARVVDPGAGSARFLVAAGRRFQDAELLVHLGRNIRMV